MSRQISKRVPFLIFADLVCIILVISLQFFFSTGIWNLNFLKFPTYFSALGLFPILFYIFDLYYPYKLFKPGLTFFEALLSVTIGILILAALSYADRSFMLPRRIFISTLLPIAPLVFLVRMLYDGLFRMRFLDKRTLIVGSGALAMEFVLVLDKTPHSGLLPVGAVSLDSKESARRDALGRIPILGKIHELSEIIRRQEVKLVVMALDAEHKNEEAEILSDLFQKNVPITSATHLLERLTGIIPRQMAEDTHYILSLTAEVKMRPYLKLKHIFDFVAAATLLILFSPVLIAAILFLAFSGPRQIFFIQDRVGLNGHLFKLIKLRSMMTSKNGKTVVTRLGKWLRRYRIDEIPQLLNVIKGDMSLVGPRPEIEYFVRRSIAKIPMYEAVFALKPGLTGWAQVKFRYTTTVKDYHEKFRYNLFYLKHMSFTLDVLILFKTVRIVLLGLGR